MRGAGRHLRGAEIEPKPSVSRKPSALVTSQQNAPESHKKRRMGSSYPPRASPLSAAGRLSPGRTGTAAGCGCASPARIPADEEQGIRRGSHSFPSAESTPPRLTSALDTSAHCPRPFEHHERISLDFLEDTLWLTVKLELLTEQTAFPGSSLGGNALGRVPVKVTAAVVELAVLRAPVRTQ